MQRAMVAVMITLSVNAAQGTVAGGMAANDKPTLDELIAEKRSGPAPYVLSEWEQEFVRTEAALYPAPEPKFLEAEDGLRLAYREWIPADWSGSGEIYLIVPGSTSHSLHFRFLGSALRDRGILTRVIDFRGTGFSVCESAGLCGDPTEYTARVAVDDGNYFPGRIGDVPSWCSTVQDLTPRSWTPTICGAWASTEQPSEVVAWGCGGGPMPRSGGRYSAKLKFQIVLEALRGELSPGQIAKQYGVHPNSVGLWKKMFLERGTEIFSGPSGQVEAERRIGDLERLIGQKEIEIALFKKTSWAGADDDVAETLSGSRSRVLSSQAAALGPQSSALDVVLPFAAAAHVRPSTRGAAAAARGDRSRAS